MPEPVCATGCSSPHAAINGQMSSGLTFNLQKNSNTEDSGKNRAHKHSNFHLIDQMRVIREGQRPDEEAHCETNAAQQRYTVQLRPITLLRKLGQPCANRQRSQTKHANLLA